MSGSITIIMCMNKSTLLSKPITSEIANLLRIYLYFKTWDVLCINWSVHWSWEIPNYCTPKRIQFKLNEWPHKGNRILLIFYILNTFDSGIIYQYTIPETVTSNWFTNFTNFGLRSISSTRDERVDTQFR